MHANRGSRAMLFEWIITSVGEALGGGIPGLVLPFFFRKRLNAAVLSGVGGFLIFPILGYFVGMPHEDPSKMIVSALLGALVGWLWFSLSNKSSK